MHNESKTTSPFFNAFCHIEIDSMKAEIRRYIGTAITQDLGPAINAAVDKAMSDGWWKAHLEKEIEASVKSLINDAVKSAIEHNWELKEDIIKHVRSVASERISNIIGGKC